MRAWSKSKQVGLFPCRWVGGGPVRTPLSVVSATCHGTGQNPGFANQPFRKEGLKDRKEKTGRGPSISLGRQASCWIEFE